MVSVAHLLGTFDPDVERVIRGKAVFYGASFDASGDRVVSPTYHDLPGVYLHAMAYDNVVSLGGSYKRADRAAWAWPSWRSAVADIGLLAALVMLWVAAGYASWSRALEAPVTPEESRGLPKAFVDRVAWTMVLVAGVVRTRSVVCSVFDPPPAIWAGASGAYGHGLRDLAEFSRDPCRHTARSPHKRNPG
jgi:CHASE2 domain-containing protein